MNPEEGVVQGKTDVFATISAKALTLPPAEREAFLDGVRLARPDLRIPLERLLHLNAPTVAGDEEPTGGRGNDDGTRAGSARPSADTVLEEGTLIGPYKLLQELGSGGMGMVYIAEQQQPVRRKVALKVVKPGMDTREVLARFEAERQALALMDHPNIARVFDAGSTRSGRPYFVMELVKGVPISEYSDKERLTTRERLELFILVCRAVQHAHQKGIIHRDLKPLNVLVSLQDGSPTPKIIDFGIAKALNQRLTEITYFTRLNQLIGTPAYMSPEQAEMSGLDVDTRSDIYSLGVMLYELLTGTTPLEPLRLRGAGYGEMQRIIREEEPPAPSTRLSTLNQDELKDIAAHRRAEPTRLGAQLRGELDWIVMKALEKERSRRYETAAAFAQDIEHYLSGDVVAARPASAAYRLSKFARRNRGWLASAAVVAGLLVAGTAVSTWQAVRATRAERVASAQRDAARQAERQEEAVSDFLVEAFHSPDPERDGRGVTIAERLDAAVAGLSERFEDAPLTKAKLLTVLGDTYTALGLADRAIPLVQEAQALRQQYGETDSRDALAGLSILAGAHYAAGQIAQAKRLYADAFERMKRALGPDDPLTLVTGRSLADLLLAEGRAADAIVLYQDVLERQRRSLPANHSETLTTEINLAYAHKRSGDSDRAIASLEAALESFAKSSLRPTHPHVLATRDLLARAYLAADRTTDAIDLFRQTLQQRKDELGPSHSHTVSTATGLAQALRKDGRTEEAIDLYEATREQVRAGGDGASPSALVLLSSLAVAYGQAGQVDKGIELLQDVVPKMEAVLLPDPGEKAIAIGNLAHLLWLSDDPERALAWQQKSLEQCRSCFGEDSPRTLAAAVRLVELLVLTGALDDGVALAESIAGRVGESSGETALLATFQTAYAAALVQQRKFDAARKLLDQALAVADDQEMDAWKAAYRQYLLGTALVGMQQYAEAEPLLRQAYEGIRQNKDQVPSAYREMVQQVVALLADLRKERSQPEP